MKQLLILTIIFILLGYYATNYMCEPNEISYYIDEPMNLRPFLISNNPTPDIEYLEQKQHYIAIFAYLRQIKTHLDMWPLSPRVSKKYIIQYLDKIIFDHLDHNINEGDYIYIFRKEIIENGMNRSTINTFKQMYKNFLSQYQIFRFKNRIRNSRRMNLGL